MINWNDVESKEREKVRYNVCVKYLRNPNRYTEADVINAFDATGIVTLDVAGRRFYINPIDGKLDVFDIEQKSED